MTLRLIPESCLPQYPALSSVYIEERGKILILERVMNEQDRRIADAIEREQTRLRNFIRRRVPDRRDVEDVLQDVFFELVEAYRLMKPIEEVGAWLFRVARNRIIDRFRRKRPESSTMTRPIPEDEEGEIGGLEDLLPSPDAGPEAAYARGVLLDELEAALEELPAEQRFVFVGLVWAVYALWNSLMPEIFGLRTITYWQALGLMALSWILFGGLRGHGRGSWRHDMGRRWGRMTPEEREAFVKALNSRWCRTESPQPEPKA